MKFVIQGSQKRMSGQSQKGPYEIRYKSYFQNPDEFYGSFLGGEVYTVATSHKRKYTKVSLNKIIQLGNEIWRLDLEHKH